MNKKSLDERIEEYVDSHQYIDGDLRPVPYDEIYPEFKQLIRDVIQEVLPEKKEWGKLEDPYDNPDIQEGFNEAIDTINSNVDSLLTGESIDA